MNMQRILKDMKLNRVLKLVFLVLVVILVVYYGQVLLTDLPDNFSRTDLMSLIREHRLSGAVLLIVILCVASCIPGIPVALFGVMAGLCLGRGLGFVVNLTGMVAGNMLAVYGLAHYDRQQRSHPHGSYQQKVANWLNHWRYPELGLILGYMIPLVPTSLVDWLLQESKLPKGLQGRVMLLGLLPTAMFYAIGGDAVLRGDGLTIGLAIGGFSAVLVLTYLGLRWLTHLRQGQSTQTPSS